MSIPGFKVVKWITKKGEKREAYYYRAPRSKGRAQIPLGTDYKVAIKKWAELHGAELMPEQDTLAAIYHAYMIWAESSASGLKPRTISDRKTYWGKLAPVFGHVAADDLASEWMLRYFEARSSQVSAKKELKFLSVLCNWGKSRGMMRAANPLTDIMRIMRVDESRDIYVEDVWFNLVYKHGSQLVRDAMDVTYICGNRPNESARARLSDIDAGRLKIALVKTEGKGNKFKMLPVEHELKKYVDRQKHRPVASMFLVCDERGQPLRTSGSKWRREWAHARDAAEIEAAAMGMKFERFYLMDIRAKAATDTAERHGIEAARKLLGHTTQKQTADYIRHIRGISARAIESINR